MSAPLPETGEEVAEQTSLVVPKRTDSETREARDELAKLEAARQGASSSRSSTLRASSSRQSIVSGMWDDIFLEGDDGEDSDMDERTFVQKMINPHPSAAEVKKPEQAYQRPTSQKSNGAPSSPRTPTTPYTDGHRGLSPTTSRSAGSFQSSPPATRSTFDSANVDPVVASKIVEEPEPIRTTSTTSIGLGKSVEEQVSPTKTQGLARQGSQAKDFAQGSDT